MKKKITQTLLPIIIGLLTMMQFACSDKNRCQVLAEKLPYVTIIHGDGTVLMTINQAEVAMAL